MNNVKLAPANIVILAAGAVMLIGSFLDFYTFGHASASAWSSGVFGIATVVVLCGVVMAAQIAVSTFANGVTLPDTVLGLSWNQIHLALAVYAALMMIGWLLLKFPVSLDRGIGFWLMFLGSAGLVVGAVMLRNEAPATGGPAAPPQAF